MMIRSFIELTRKWRRFNNYSSMNKLILDVKILIIIQLFKVDMKIREFILKFVF